MSTTRFRPAPIERTESAACDLNHTQRSPDALLIARSALLARGAHLHGPEIAQRLGVTEATLMAARIGFGAEALVPDLPALLAPVGAWSKLLLAVRSSFGVALALGRFAQVETEAAQVTIANDEHRISVSYPAVATAFLVDEEDPFHGHGVSINAFDANGDALLRVYLMSKDGRDVAAGHLERFIIHGASRLWQPARSEQPPGVPPLGAPPSAPDSTERAGRILRQALLALPEAPTATLELRSNTSHLRTTARASQSHETPPVVHATGPALKLHLRPSVAHRLYQTSESSGIALNWVAATGDRLCIGPATTEPTAEFDRWRRAVLDPAMVLTQIGGVAA